MPADRRYRNAGPAPCCCCGSGWCLPGQRSCAECADHFEPCHRYLDSLQRFAATLDDLAAVANRWRRRDYGGRAGA